MILLNVHPDISRGRDDVLALMFDMNDLWEQYAALQIRKHLRDRFTVAAQKNNVFWESILPYPGAVEEVSKGVSGEYRTPDGSRCHVLSLNVLDAAGRFMLGREYCGRWGSLLRGNGF